MHVGRTKRTLQEQSYIKYNNYNLDWQINSRCKEWCFVTKSSFFHTIISLQNTWNYN